MADIPIDSTITDCLKLMVERGDQLAYMIRRVADMAQAARTFAMQGAAGLDQAGAEMAGLYDLAAALADEVFGGTIADVTKYYAGEPIYTDTPGAAPGSRGRTYHKWPVRIEVVFGDNTE